MQNCDHIQIAIVCTSLILALSRLRAEAGWSDWTIYFMISLSTQRLKARIYSIESNIKWRALSARTRRVCLTPVDYNNNYMHKGSRRANILNTFNFSELAGIKETAKKLGLGEHLSVQLNRWDMVYDFLSFLYTSYPPDASRNCMSSGGMLHQLVPDWNYFLVYFNFLRRMK